MPYHVYTYISIQAKVYVPVYSWGGHSTAAWCVLFFSYQSYTRRMRVLNSTIKYVLATIDTAVPGTYYSYMF